MPKHHGKVLCVESRFHTLAKPALDAWEWSACYSSYFTPGESGQPMHWIGGLAGPLGSSGHSGIQKNLLPYQKLNPSHTVCTHHFTD
jgi:hypothetical protein